MDTGSRKRLAFGVVVVLALAVLTAVASGCCRGRCGDGDGD